MTTIGLGEEQVQQGQVLLELHLFPSEKRNKVGQTERALQSMV